MANVMIMAGGTGGHVYPALAVAKNLASLGCNVSWLGTQAGIESHVVPQAGLPIWYLKISGFRGKNKLAQLLAPFKLLLATLQAVVVIRKIRPDVVIGFGGFVAAPGGLAAKILGKPLVIHEQNAIAGSTNKMLSHIASKVLEGFKGTLACAVFTGNPVRQGIVTKSQQALTQPPNILVLGGSLGAQALNQIVPVALKSIDANIWHQTGRGKLAGVEERYQVDKLSSSMIRVSEFIDCMDEAFDWADLVICRAGAMTVSEVSYAGLPAIFIPYPYAIDNHQWANAKWLVDQGAAKMIVEQELSAALLQAMVLALINDHSERIQMAKAAAAASPKSATQVISELCLEVAHG